MRQLPIYLGLAMTATLGLGAARGSVTLKAAAGIRTFELTVGAPDSRFEMVGNFAPAADLLPVRGGTGYGTGQPGSAGVGPGDMMGLPGHRGPEGGPPDGARRPNPDDDPHAHAHSGGGPHGGAGRPRGAGGPAGPPGPKASIPIGLEGMLDIGQPTHGASLRIKTKAGALDMGFPPPRLVAVRQDLGGVAMTMLRQLTHNAFSSNVALPGKGRYQLYVRAYASDGRPIGARFDFTYR